MPEQLTIGLDIGGTKMAFAVVDASGNICDEVVLPTLHDNPYQVTINRIAEQVNHYLERYPNIIGIGIGVPGPVDNVKGIALNAVNLSWENRHIIRDLQGKLSRAMPMYLENDVNVGAIGEMLFGLGKGTSDFIYIAIGTGMRGAVMADGKLMRGASSCEMEIGHMSLDPVNGLPCTCGQRGCVEMAISGKGFVATAQANFDKFPDTKLTRDNISTHEIIHHADDDLARFVLDNAAEALGLCCAWCTMIFNPSLIILGGGLSHATYDLLKTKTMATMKAHCLPQSFDAVTVAPSKLTNAALGASALALYFKSEA